MVSRRFACLRKLRANLALASLRLGGCPLFVCCVVRGGRSMRPPLLPSPCRRSGSRRPCLLRRPSSHLANSTHPRRGCSRIRLSLSPPPVLWRGPWAVSVLISRTHVRSLRAAPFWIALLGDLRDCLPRWYFASFCLPRPVLGAYTSCTRGQSLCPLFITGRLLLAGAVWHGWIVPPSRYFRTPFCECPGRGWVGVRSFKVKGVVGGNGLT